MGVACRNAQLGTSEAEDDLEHTGHTYFSHCVRQPAHQTGAGAQALHTSRASSPRIYPVLLLQGADAETTSGPALGVMGGYRPLVWEDLTICSVSMVAGMSLASGRERLSVSYFG